MIIGFNNGEIVGEFDRSSFLGMRRNCVVSVFVSVILNYRSLVDKLSVKVLVFFFLVFGLSFCMDLVRII